jgi:hypothetical protein
MGRPTQKQDVDMDAEVDVESSDLDDAIDALAKVSNDFT